MSIGEAHAFVDEIIRPRVLHLVTVEFASEEKASASRPVEWFGAEVTEDRRYTHQSIALRGLDDAPEIPLSDAALNSLIDTLEDRFPVQARTAINKAKQVPVTRARAQTSAEAVQVNLDEIEQAMMREMEKTLRKGKPE